MYTHPNKFILLRYVDEALDLQQTLKTNLRLLSPKEFEGLLHPIFQVSLSIYISIYVATSIYLSIYVYTEEHMYISLFLSLSLYYTFIYNIHIYIYIYHNTYI